MFCPKCGNKHSESARFCPKCGSEIKIHTDATVGMTGNSVIDVQLLKNTPVNITTDAKTPTVDACTEMKCDENINKNSFEYFQSHKDR